MKNRTDFVSNSSSSSFIVIGDNTQKFNFNDQTIEIPNSDEGQKEFGWQFEKYDDFWSKLNFCAIQLDQIKENYKYAEENYKNSQEDWEKRIYKNYKEWYDRLDNMWDTLVDVCRSEFHLNIELKDHDKIDHMFAYIDHQSSVTDNDNMEMFDSYDSLYRFLSCSDSYIKCGNDNDEGPEDWYDKR